MKAFLAGLGAGFVLSLLAVRNPSLARRPWNLRYQWRDPEDRLACNDRDVREKMMDKTIADSFPASDPPSSIPNPSEDSLVA